MEKLNSFFHCTIFRAKPHTARCCLLRFTAVLKPHRKKKRTNNMNEQFRKKFSQTFKSHFDSDALLKLTDVYFVIAGNEARISFTRF